MMLKSTHRSAGAPPPLPGGWTEHKAPTGYTYFYHAATGQSTYTRPAVAPQLLPQPIPAYDPTALAGGASPLGAPSNGLPSGPWNGSSHAHGANTLPLQARRPDRRPQPNDRPKSKKPIPGSPPWILVYTKLRRRFVHNPETGESLWKFPQDIMMAVIDMDHKEREERARVERGEATAENEEEAPSLVPKQGKSPPTGAAEKQPIEAANKDVKDYDSDEYEEVEVTDDEDADKARKRQKLEQEEPARPVEFNEEDIAFQLAAMGHEPDDPAGGEEWGEDYEEELLNEEDANALFVDLLEDFHINPFTPWETIVEEGKIIEDDRYTCLPNMKARKDVWTDWSRNKMHAIREQRQQQEKRDPRIPYMALLQKHATPKLYWSEFKRKFRKEPEMRDTKLVDRDREKWYREYISRLKLPETTLKSDLTALLKAQPLTALNRSTSLEALPSALLVDLRYVSVPARVRDPLVEAYIAIQPSAPADAGADAEAAAEETRRRAERERRENALEERERRVKEEKRRNRASLEQGRERLREEEEEVERAMKVGRDGLRGHVQGEG